MSNKLIIFVDSSDTESKIVNIETRQARKRAILFVLPTYYIYVY
jgi:hypothetical protein